MSVVRRHLKNGDIGPEKLSLSLLAKRYCLELFMGEPIAIENRSAAFAGGTDTNRIVLDTGFNRFEYTYIGGASDLFVPILGSEGGYDWQLDKDTAAEGVSINFGSQVVGHPRTYRPLTEDFFARLLLNCEDASGLSALFGLIDTGAIPAGVTDYTNYVGLRVLGDSSSTTAMVRAESNLGNSGSTDSLTVTESNTLEEPTEIELELRVLGGRAYYLINGVVVSQAGLTTLYTGTPTVSPVAQLTQTTDITSRLNTRAYESGLFADRYPGTLRSILTAVGVAAGT